MIYSLSERMEPEINQQLRPLLGLLSLKNSSRNDGKYFRLVKIKDYNPKLSERANSCIK